MHFISIPCQNQYFKWAPTHGHMVIKLNVARRRKLVVKDIRCHGNTYITSNSLSMNRKKLRRAYFPSLQYK